ncbi:MAG: DUF1501 domain-containing protein [Saccharospirillum sp.]
MKRRDFLKALSVSGMAASVPAFMSGKAQAQALTPVGRYFVLLHLGGGWDPTSFCDPKGNILRGSVDSGARNAGSPVNRFCSAAIRRVADVALATGIDPEMKYAPYLGTFNPDDIDVAGTPAQNTAITTEHIQRILAGARSGAAGDQTLTAVTGAGFDWSSARASDAANIDANARGILEGTIDTIEMGALASAIEGVDFSGVGNTQLNANLFVYDAFCCLYADKIRVLNGIDNRTNGHDTGTRFSNTGSMDSAFPDFSALYAAVQGADRPLAFITDGGGNNETAGLVPRSSASDVSVFNTLAEPEGDYLPGGMKTLVDQAKSRRRSLLDQKETLPRRHRLQSQLYLVRDEGVAFSGVASELANPTDPSHIALRDRARNNRQRQMRIGAASMQAGMASSMQIGFGGFDTHNNHDQQHFNRIRDVLIDLHYLWDALEVYGVGQETTILLASDFGRTPWYNSGEGKDHWAVGSYIALGKDVVGGTVLNATDPLVGPMNVTISGRQMTPVAPNTSGSTRLTAAHLHQQMRVMAGIDQHPFAQQFPIDIESVPVFG